MNLPIVKIAIVINVHVGSIVNAKRFQRAPQAPLNALPDSIVNGKGRRPN